MDFDEISGGVGYGPRTDQIPEAIQIPCLIVTKFFTPYCILNGIAIVYHFLPDGSMTMEQYRRLVFNIRQMAALVSAGMCNLLSAL